MLRKYIHTYTYTHIYTHTYIHTYFIPSYIRGDRTVSETHKYSIESREFPVKAQKQNPQNLF